MPRKYPDRARQEHFTTRPYFGSEEACYAWEDAQANLREEAREMQREAQEDAMIAWEIR